MRKVIKIFFSLFAWLVLAGIIIPLWLALMLYLPPVQTFAVRRAADIVSDKIGAEVSVEGVHIRFFNRLSLKGVYVEDLQQDTLFYVKELSVGTSVSGLFGGDLSLGKVKLVEPKFYLHQQEDSLSNLKHVLRGVEKGRARKKGGKVFKMRAAGLEIVDMSFRHTKCVRDSREYGVNFTDLDTKLHRLDVERVAVYGDSISMRIKDISLRDKSGFEVAQLSAHDFSVSGSGLRFKGLEFDASGSHVEMDSLNLLYTEWGMADFLNSVRFESRMRNTVVDFGTIAYFAPSLRDWKMVVSGADAFVEGPVADMRGRFERARVYGSDLAMSFAMVGLPDVDNTRFDFVIDELRTDADDVKSIFGDVAKNAELPDNVYAKLEELGEIGVVGSFSGLLNDFQSQAHLETEQGDVGFDMGLRPGRDKTAAFSGNIEIDGFNLGGFVNVDGMGRLSMSATLDGFVGKDVLEARTNTVISDFGFNGYDYNSIQLDGTIKNRLFLGKISSSDPNLDFDFDGMLDFNDSIPRYDFALKLRNADLARLNVNKRDSVSLLSCELNATASGGGIDELNGEVAVGNVTYMANADTLTTAVMTVTGRNSKDSKNIEFRSDFADVDFRSRTSYTELIPQIQNMLRVYMPTLSPRERGQAAEDVAVNAPADASNYSILKVNVKETANLAGVLLPGLVVAKGTKVSLLFNPYIRKFSLDATSEYLEYNDNFASDLEINSRDEGDSLVMYLRADDLYAAGLYMPHFSVNAGVRDNVVNAAMRFANHQNGISALIGAHAVLGRDTLDGKAMVNLRLTPSSITSNGRVWNMFARNVVFKSRDIRVGDFAIVGSGQLLTVNGAATDNREDTLRVKLSNFDIAPLSQLTSQMGYSLSGKLNGGVDMMSVMNNGIVEANIGLDSVVVNQTRMPSLAVSSLWDFENERARFSIVSDGDEKPVVRGYYLPLEKRYMAFLDAEGIDMALLDPFLQGAVSGTTGKANANLEFTGVGRELKTNGKITVPELTTKVDYLNVNYTVKNGEIEFVDNKLTLHPTRFVDQEGNEGMLDLSVDLNNLKNVAFTVNTRPRNMLVLNTTENESDMFYGKVYASGNASIVGDKRGTNISVNATTADNSEFHLPLSGKTDALRSDLVVFKEPDMAYADSSDYLVRKRMIVERKNRNRMQSESSALNIDMVLNVLPNALVEIVIDPKMGGALRGRGNGSITMNINPSSNTLNMYGDYQITEGVYTLVLHDIIERNFMIADGSSLQWTGDPVDAMLNVSAVYKLKASLAPLLDDAQYSGTVPVECWLMMSERLSQPHMTFNISLPTSEPNTQTLVANSLNTQEMMATQFFSLITLRKFYRDIGQGVNIGSASAGADELVNILSSQLTNWLSNDRFNIGLTYRSQSEYNSDEVNLDFSTYLAGNRLLLEVEGNYDAKNTPNLSTRNVSNLSGDFALTWLIDRSGNLRLKGFTRTIDRFDENQGLQESGIGLYYREDFNNLNDLWRNIKQRFSIFERKKRQDKESRQPDGDADENGEGKEDDFSDAISRPDMQEIKSDSVYLPVIEDVTPERER